MADVSVDATISTATARGMRAVVFPSELIGFVFYLDSDGVFGYSKTTDGGATWGAQVNVDSAAATTVVAFDIWFDRWTPGDTGNLIHTWWFDVTNDTIRYRTLNVTNDVLGTQIDVFAHSSAVAGRGAFVSGTKTRSGYLYVASDIDAGAERGFRRSTNGGATWSPTNLSTSFVEATLDTCKLFPASNTGDDNDCWALYYDASATALTLKLWDSSAATEVESATIGVAHTDGATDLTGQFGYDGAVRHTDGHLIVAKQSTRDVAAGTHQVFDITSTASIATKTAIAASTDDHYYPQVFINQGTGTIFVAYNGKRDGSEVLDTTTKVYYTYSTDGGTTWNAGDAAYMEGAAGVVQQVWTGKADARFYVVWRVGTTLLGNKVNSLIQLGAQGVTIASGSAVNVPTVIPSPTAVTGTTIGSGSTANRPPVVSLHIVGATIGGAPPALGTEAFTGTGALSGDWTQLQGSAARLSGTLSHWISPFNTSYRWTASTPDPDQYAQLTILNHSDYGGGPACRMSAGENFYAAVCHSGATRIDRCLGGSFSTLATLAAVAVGSVVRIVATGTTIEVFDDGVSLGSTTDPNLTAGSGGFYNYGDTAGQTDKASFDDFEVGNLGGGGAQTFAPSVAVPQMITGATIGGGGVANATRDVVYGEVLPEPLFAPHAWIARDIAANRLAIAIFLADGPLTNATAITSPNLTWTRHVLVTDSGVNQICEIWTAWCPTALTGEVLTSTFSGGAYYNRGAAILLTVQGTDAAGPGASASVPEPSGDPTITITATAAGSYLVAGLVGRGTGDTTEDVNTTLEYSTGSWAGFAFGQRVWSRLSTAAGPHTLGSTGDDPFDWMMGGLEIEAAASSGGGAQTFAPTVDSTLTGQSLTGTTLASAAQSFVPTVTLTGQTITGATIGGTAAPATRDVVYGEALPEPFSSTLTWTARNIAANRLAVAIFLADGPLTNATTITSPNLTWTRRVLAIDAAINSIGEIWTAWCPAALTGEVITQTFSGGAYYNRGSAILLTVQGTDASGPANTASEAEGAPDDPILTITATAAGSYLVAGLVGQGGLGDTLEDGNTTVEYTTGSWAGFAFGRRVWSRLSTAAGPHTLASVGENPFDWLTAGLEITAVVVAGGGAQTFAPTVEAPQTITGATIGGARVTLVSDAFTRANSASLGSPWTDTQYGWEVNGNTARPEVQQTGANEINCAAMAGVSGADQWAQVTVVSAGPWSFYGPTIHDAGGLQRFGFVANAWYPDAPNAAPGGVMRMTFQRHDGGTYPVIVAQVDGITVNVGSTLRIQQIGDTVTGFVDDVEVLSYTDPAPLTSGTAGLMALWSSIDPVPALDEFSAGVMGGGAAQVFVPTITQGAGEIAVTGAVISATTTVYAPVAVPGAVTILGATCVSTSLVHTPLISTGAVTIDGTHRPTTAQAFVPSVAVGAVTVTTSPHTTAIQVFAPALTSVSLGATIPSSSGAFAPEVALSVEMATCGSTLSVSAPSVAPRVALSRINSTNQRFAPTVVNVDKNLTGARIVSAGVRFAPTVVNVDLGVQGAFIEPDLLDYAWLTKYPTEDAIDYDAVYGPGTSSAWVAMEFDVANPDVVTAIDIRAVRTGTPTDNLFVELRAGGRDGTVIGTSALLAGSTPPLAPAQSAFITLLFPTPVVVTPGLHAWVLKRDGTASATDYVRCRECRANTTVPNDPLRPGSVDRAHGVQIWSEHVTPHYWTDYTAPTYYGVEYRLRYATGIYAPTVAAVEPSDVTVSGAHLPTAETLTAPTVGVGVTAISGTTLASTALVFAPSFIARLDGTFLGSSAQPFAPSVQITQVVTGAHSPATVMLFAPSTLPVSEIGGATRLSTAVLLAPAVAVGAVTILGGTIPVTTQVYAAAVLPDAVLVTAGHLPSVLQVFAPSVLAIATGAHVPTAIQMFAVTVTPGPVVVIGTTIVLDTHVFAPALGTGVTGTTLTSMTLAFAPTLAGHILTAAWIPETEIFPPSALPLGELIGPTLPSGAIVFPPYMVGHAPPPEILDFTSNLVREVMGESTLDRVAEHNAVLTTAVAGDVILTRLYETTTRVLVDRVLASTVER